MKPKVLPTENLDRTPPAPKYLTPAGRRIWKATTRQLQAMGVLYEIHLPFIGAFVNELARYQDLNAQLAELDSPVVETEHYMSVDPRFALADRALANALKIGAKFGFTLSDLGGLTLPANNASTDPYEAGRDKPRLTAVG